MWESQREGPGLHVLGVIVANPAIQSFGKYQILDRIATGATAEIYKARLEGIGGFQRTFAIKRILPALSQNGDYIGMLVDEAKVAGLLSHANIVQILDLGQVDGIWYIAMEYVDGRDLGAVLRRVSSKALCMPVPHAVFVVIELLKGLEYAHQRQVMKGGRPVALNIIHRDVSPPNVLMSFQGEVKLTDFGIARASLKAMETASGIAPGRFDYMSPEQADGAKDLDQRSDLFSVGVLLYEMLTGHHPFRADSEIATIDRIRAGDHTPVRQVNAEVPASLEVIVDKALSVSRNERYASATAFKEALDDFFHDAGFIFTHATLAQYVRGLFPEASARGRSHADDSRGGELDGPTRRLDIGGDPSVDSRPGDLRRSPGLPKTLDEPLDDEDQETLIRKIPDGWEEELAAGNKAPPEKMSTSNVPQLPASNVPKQWDEQHTIIRRSLEGEEDRGATSFPGSTGDGRSAGRSASGRSGSGRSSSGRTGDGRSASGKRGRTGGGRRRSQAGVIGWVAAVIALFVGVGVGGLLTAVAGLLLGFRPANGDPTLSEPFIHVLAPPDTEVRVDGVVVGRRTEVTPGESHNVQIKPKDQRPFEDDMVLNRGEYRVIMVSEPQQ